MFINNFISLYKQYRLERRIRTILTLSYKYKLIIYSKVFIFSILYCLSFIILHIILISSHFNYYGQSINYVYYLNINLELFFIIILAIIFFLVILYFIFSKLIMIIIVLFLFLKLNQVLKII